MAFLPGLSDAVSKTYTVLDDIVEAATKGHDVLFLLNELTLAIAHIFRHTDVSPSQLKSPIEDPLHVFWVNPDSSAAPFSATTRSEKIARDLQPL